MSIDELLKEINEDIFAHGKGQLSIEELSEIAAIHQTIDALGQNGITKDTYGTKVKQYINFVSRAWQEYGIEISDTCPFDDPTKLWSKIQKILVNAGLSKEQMTKFYSSTGIRKRAPKQKDSINSIFLSLPDDAIASTEKDYQEWYDMGQEEQDKIIGITPKERAKMRDYEEAAEEYLRQRLKHKKSIQKLRYNPTK